MVLGYGIICGIIYHIRHLTIPPYKPESRLGPASSRSIEPLPSGQAYCPSTKVKTWKVEVKK